MKRAFLPVVALMCLLFCSSAKASPAEHERLVTKVIELSETDKIFDSLPGVFSAIATQRQMVSKNAAEEKELFDAIIDAIDVEQARNMLTDYISKNSDDDTLKAMLAWLETPLGKKISAEEARADKEQDQSDMVRYLSELQSTPPPKERIDIIQRFVEQNKMPEILAKMVKGALVAMVSGLSEGDDSKAIEVGELEKSLQQDGDKLIEAMRQQSILTSFYTDRSISDAEMEQYMKFMATDKYKKFEKVLVGGIEASLNTTFKAVGKKVAEKVKEIRVQNDEGCED